MAEKTKLNIAWQEIERVPGLVSGDDALMIYDSLPEQARNGIRHDKASASKSVIGSNNLAVACLDSVAKQYGARTTNLRDLSRPEVMAIAEGKHYIDARTLVARSPTDSYGRNNSLLKTIYELAEQELGKVDGSFMVENFNLIPDEEDKTGYGLKLVKAEDFAIVQDERLDGKYDERSFSEVDELGLPKFDSNGSRNWFAKDKGLSGLCLDRDLELYSDNEDLADSNDSGRVVFLK